MMSGGSGGMMSGGSGGGDDFCDATPEVCQSGDAFQNCCGSGSGSCPSECQAYTMCCPSGSGSGGMSGGGGDPCSEGHDDRPGANSEEKCLAMSGCVYDSSTDHCYDPKYGSGGGMMSGGSGGGMMSGSGGGMMSGGGSGG